MKAILRTAVVTTALLAAGAGFAQSQSGTPSGDYPNRQVRIVIPFPPGGVADVVGRLLAQKLTENTGQNFFVENRGGAAGNIGAAMVQALPPDGYTFLLTSSSFLINPGLQKVPYEPVAGFAPITIISASPSILAIHPGQSAKSVKDLIDLVKKEPGKHSYASAGVGSTPHLQGEMFKQAFGLDMVHVPFAGGGPALQSAVAGHTPIVFAALPPAIPLVKSGDLRALAIVGPKRVSSLADVPTMTEAGLPGQEAETILLALAPAGTPRPVIDRLQKEIVKAVQSPDVVQKLDVFGFSPLGTTPAEADARIKSELGMWAKVVKDAKIEK
jgi:tripartite-type tricarboxylate transporter receptor subunit TctC